MNELPFRCKFTRLKGLLGWSTISKNRGDKWERMNNNVNAKNNVPFPLSELSIKRMQQASGAKKPLELAESLQLLARL